MSSKPYTAGLVVIFVCAFLVNMVVGVKGGLARPMQSDASYYLKIASSLAQGQGFMLHEGFWPNTPTMSRSPAWPFVVSGVLRLFPSVSPDLAMRLLALGLNAGLAVLVAGLAFRITRKMGVAMVAGLAYVIHPVALYLAYEGESEILFLILAVGGTSFLLSTSRWRWLGFLLLGSASLVRANFVLWIVFFAILSAALMLLFRDQISRRWVWQGILAVILFLLPPMLWAGRNYHVCGHFPVFSTLRGQTLYGGNNPVVANDLEYWGYWIFPNSIPGETPMVTLSETKSEFEVDCYYYSLGKKYIRDHWFSMPRLLLGKVIRAYVPVPWKPNWGSYAVSAYRWLLYGLAVVGLCLIGRGVGRVYGTVISAMLVTNVITVLVFWGCGRFAFAVEPFLLPFAAVAIWRLLVLGGGMSKSMGGSWR